MSFCRITLTTIFVLLSLILVACGGGGGGGGGGNACVDKGALPLDTLTIDNALTDLDGHCYTISLTAGTHYTFTLSATTPLGSSLALIHDGSNDGLTGTFANQGAPQNLVVNLPESRDYIVQITGDGYTINATQAGAPNVSIGTTITSLTGPASITNGQPLDLNVTFLLDDSSDEARIGFHSGTGPQVDPAVEAIFNNLDFVTDPDGTPSTAFVTTARFETRGDPLATGGTILFPEIFARGGTGGGTTSSYLLDWPTSAYTGYMLTQIGGNADRYYGTDSLTPLSITVNNPPTAIACTPPTLSAALTVPASFVIGDMFNVSVPFTGANADIAVTVTDAGGLFSAIGTVTNVTAGTQVVTIDTNAIPIVVGENLLTVVLTLNANAQCEARYPGAATGNYTESQYDAGTGERFLVQTSVPVSTITATP